MFRKTNCNFSPLKVQKVLESYQKRRVSQGEIATTIIKLHNTFSVTVHMSRVSSRSDYIHSELCMSLSLMMIHTSININQFTMVTGICRAEPSF